MVIKKNIIVLSIFIVLIVSVSILLPFILNRDSNVIKDTSFKMHTDDISTNLYIKAYKLIEAKPLKVEEPKKEVLNKEEVNNDTKSNKNTSEESNNTESKSEETKDKSTDIPKSVDENKLNKDYVKELIEENKDNIEEEDLETGNSIYEKLNTELIFSLTEGGLTDIEKQQIKDHMHEVLTDEEYKTAFELLNKYIGLTE